MASVWTISATGVALVAEGSVDKALEFLERPRNEGRLDPEDSEFSPLKCVQKYRDWTKLVLSVAVGM